MKNILVGYDGSNAADVALTLAADLARRYDARLHVLAVVLRPEIPDDVETEAWLERSQASTDVLLNTISKRYPDIELSLLSQIGHPAEQLLQYAEDRGIDHIVLGDRGRSQLERWLLGSVSRRVVTHASCTVTVARQSS